MKDLIKAYTSFTRLERIGIVCLSSIIILLLAFRMSMPYWVKPKTDIAEEKRLEAAWEIYKRSQPKAKAEETINAGSDEYTDASDDNESPLPAVININTADSQTLVRLKGIGPVMTHKIIIYRKIHGLFKNTHELLDIQSIPEATFNVLQKHLSVSDSLK